jgi:hypothetical protein
MKYATRSQRTQTTVYRRLVITNLFSYSLLLSLPSSPRSTLQRPTPVTKTTMPTITIALDDDDGHQRPTTTDEEARGADDASRASCMFSFFPYLFFYTRVASSYNGGQRQPPSPYPYDESGIFFHCSFR